MLAIFSSRKVRPSFYRKNGALYNILITNILSFKDNPTTSKNRQNRLSKVPNLTCERAPFGLRKGLFWIAKGALLEKSHEYTHIGAPVYSRKKAVFISRMKEKAGDVL